MKNQCLGCESENITEFTGYYECNNCGGSFVNYLKL